jgi:hypothetical protein
MLLILILELILILV